ncbi:MAG: 5'/3'-nucleotidase SurE [Candidatus Aminicenantes bacterium RBG_19FT_COMBO_58_17]|jgi:5'-nucleotidase|nr:MAG: 5'/3'-nucleotidase SurE [Candidatus Aminicenantes bacterium RBG_19FT_COMBO_58_17]
MKPLILLTNDDGYFADGILALARHLKRAAETVVVAPDREKSATSLSLTLRRPLRVERIKRDVFAVDGTPADCIYLALKMILQRSPCLIISGINRGPNLGQQDISYSGTVAAAIQGTFLGIPSVAVSAVPNVQGEHDFDLSAEFIFKLAKRILKKRLPAGLTLNVNIPAPPIQGARMTKLGEKRYDPEIVEKRDPRDNTYYWIGSGKPTPIGDRTSDVWAVARGFISVTPLHTDLTDYAALSNPSWKKIIQGLV